MGADDDNADDEDDDNDNENKDENDEDNGDEDCYRWHGNASGKGPFNPWAGRPGRLGQAPS